MTLPIAEARRNDELISLSDSQILRFIDELNGVKDADYSAKLIKNEIKALKKEANSLQNRRKIKKLYEKLDSLQFKPDYMCLIIDREKDYWRACRGFRINGVRYVRLLGTNGGIKNSTIVFVSERLAPELRRRIDNGRDKTMELVPAKLEAYQALVCSGSTPVSMPKGIAVVNDCMTRFKDNVINLSDECEGEPVMVYEEGADIEADASDGFGLMLPSLAERWSQDLKLDYVVSGVNTRFSWEKGMVFTFDFLEFADKVAGTRTITDAWGNEVDLSDVELILTTSMLKLWDSYESCEHYLRCCLENKYTFGIPKTCPKELEKERNLNYQFVQSYELDDEQIEELVAPTIQEIHDVLSLDWRKTVLFLKGVGLNEGNVESVSADFAKAIMVEPKILEDPYVRKKIFELIKKRITDAKIGVIKVHGNYSIISGDPYALCQSIFGLEVTGLLGAGEVFNKFWVDNGSNKLACFRAPMTCHNNIRLVNVAAREDVLHWFQYMNTCTVLNSWDTAPQALNGCDFDGDLVMLTDNRILVENLKEMPAIMCAQRRAKKCVPTELDFIRSNINSFGDDIGKITNRITSMFDVMAQYEKGSREYEVLDYRIKCGQLFQQNAIDRAKGIISKPMPKTWYDRMSIYTSGMSDEEKEFELRVVADKKPYFMRYIYQTLMKQYNAYISNSNRKALRDFRKSMNELLESPSEELSPEELDFVKYYKMKMPVGVNDCTMNRICRRIESEFDGYIVKHKSDYEFDYRIMKCGRAYTNTPYQAALKLYKDYVRKCQEYIQKTNRENRVDEDVKILERTNMREIFYRECSAVCSNSRLMCDILLDICYKREGTKQFVWDMCAPDIVENLLEHNDGYINYITLDEGGDIAFSGERFSCARKKIMEGCNEYSNE